MIEDLTDPETRPDLPVGAIPADAGRDFRPGSQFYRIEREWVQLARLGGVLGALGLSAALFIPAAIGYFSGLPSPLPRLIGGAWMILSILALLRAWLWPALSYRRYLYRVDPTRIQIRRGVLWREVLDVPRNRIQHTDVAQGPLERSFELSHLVIHTAGTRMAAVRLDGLREEIAYRIRNELLETRIDDAV